MSTKTMIAIVFIITILGMMTGVAYSIFTRQGEPAFFSVLVGALVSTVVIIINAELE